MFGFAFPKKQTVLLRPPDAYVGTPPVFPDAGGSPAEGGHGESVIEQIYGQTNPHYPEIGPQIVVNPREFGITGWGDANGALIDVPGYEPAGNPGQAALGDQGIGSENVVTTQLFQSGHTNNLITNESADQGLGVGPERRMAHYPTADNPNPYRNLNATFRNGGDTYSAQIYRPVVTAYWAQALGLELSQGKVKQRPNRGTVNQAPSQPYTNVVPPMTPGGY